MRPPLRLLAALPLLALAACTAAPAAPTPGTAITLPAPKATLVIVHGAWGGGWAFRDVDRLLSADGYAVRRPTLTGQGERAHLSSPDINLSLHIQDVVNHILFEDLHDVVLVGHSYGGMVITGVADRIPDRIKKCIYLDALVPADGESVDSLFTTRLTPVSPDGFMRPTWTVPPNPPHDVLMSAKCFSEKISLKNQAAAAKIPAAYILTVDPGQQPPQDRFYMFYQRAQQRGWPTTIMTAGHNPQWSHPQELAKLLEANAR
jgi:pimeloyl-ACP methyl ester carboxylesterase